MISNAECVHVMKDKVVHAQGPGFNPRPYMVQT